MNKEQDKITLSFDEFVELKNDFKAEIKRRAEEANVTHHRPNDRDIVEIIFTVCPWIGKAIMMASRENILERFLKEAIEEEKEDDRNNEA